MGMVGQFRGSVRDGDLAPLAPHAAAVLFGCGAVLVAGSCLLPGRTRPGVALVASVLAVVAASLLVLLASRITNAVLNVLVGLGSVLIASVIFSSGTATSPDSLLYLWVALFGGFFLSVWAMIAQTAFMAVAYGLVLVALPVRTGPSQDVSAQHFVLVVGAVSVATVWVAGIRMIVNLLLAQQLRLARTDSLTGLANRAELVRCGGDAFERRARWGHDVAVLLIDLDGFKGINDRLGHAAGDAILQSVAQRLSSLMRGGEVVARLGGDEFAVLLNGREAAEPFDTVAVRVEQALEHPHPLNDREVGLRASIGVAVAREHATIEELVRDADLAMYAAKSAGGGRRRFDRSMSTRAAEHLVLTEELRWAVESDQFSLRFQPIVQLGTNLTVAVEALVRWEHPIHGTITPDSFIPHAEATGLIVPLGHWVLHRACEAASSWTAANTGPPVVTVNISPRQLLHDDVVPDVRRALAAHGLPAGRLMLEITETSLITDSDAAVARLRQLRDLGLSIAIDDFGTGYSSLAYLRRLPVSDVKLARPFVQGLDADHASVALARGIIDLAHALDLRVIAEGVETSSQLQQLRDLGCDHAQGFLLARPMLPAQLANHLARTRPTTTHSAPTAKR